MEKNYKSYLVAGERDFTLLWFYEAIFSVIIIRYKCLIFCSFCGSHSHSVAGKTLSVFCFYLFPFIPHL